ncbi:phage major capsid protein [Terasakiella sp.]|uniref:phage major capsid protein n=1 Tax=Terasakiella sp. TaxID=2034861 RepID=UPI003AA8CB82
MTRSVTPEQIISGMAKKGGVLRRQATIRSFDEENRTVELAFSSETPVMRWFGEEVLDHSPEAINTERLEDGAALLMNHDWEDQVGVVESVTIGADRVGRAVVRLGKGVRASEIWQDIVDGIRRHVSVGYSIQKVEVETREGMPDLVRVIDWLPYEISLVSVPADPTVGVGRSMETSPEETEQPSSDLNPSDDTTPTKETGEMKIKQVRDHDGNLVKAEVDDEGNITRVLSLIKPAEASGGAGNDDPAQAAQTERQNAAAIMSLGRKFNVVDLAADAIQRGVTPTDFNREVLDHLNAERSGSDLEDHGQADIGLTPNEVRQFSFMKAVRALANPNDKRAQEAAAFEFEASRAAADIQGKEARGIMVPTDVMRRALNTDTSGAASGDTGGNLVATDLASQSFIQMLRNRAKLLQLGTPLGGLVGNVEIPRQIGGATGYWLGEDDDTTETGAEFDQISLAMKTVGAYTEITRNMMKQSSLDAEALLRSDLSTAMALTIDHSGFYGSGSGNEPLGIKNLNGVNAVEFAATLPTYAEVVQMETEISSDNADVNAMAYVGNSGMRGHFKTAQKFAGTNGATIWEPGGTVNGYRTEITNQVTAGDLFHGNFADLLVAMWGGLDLTVDPYSDSKKGRIRLIAFQDVDLGYRHPESFCYGVKPAA